MKAAEQGSRKLPASAGQSPDDVRARLLEAAQELFIQDGFVRISVDAIVRAAKTSKREYYRCFRNKEELFVEVVRLLIESNTGPMVLPDGPPMEVLLDAARMTYTSHLTDRSTGLYRVSISAAERSPGLARSVYLARSRGAEPLVHYIERHRDELGLQYDDAFLSALRFSFVAVDGLRYLMGTPALTAEQLDRRLADVVDLFLNGHATPEFRRLPKLSRRIDGHLHLCSNDGIQPQPNPASSTRLGTDDWDNIHRTAWAEFLAHGYAGASLGVISRRTHVARTTIYRHYASKEALFIALAEEVVDRQFDLQAKIDLDHSSVVDALYEVCLLILDRYLHPDTLGLQRILLVEAANNPEMTSRLYERMVARVQEFMQPLLQALAEAGVLRAEHFSDSCLRFFVLTTFGGRFLYVAPRNRVEREAHARETVNVFLYGWRQP